MYEYMAEFKPIHVMELPNRVSEDGLVLWKNEIIRMKEKLEEVFGITITEDDIRKGIQVKNAERSAIKKFYSIMKADELPVSGMDVQKTWWVRHLISIGKRFHPNGRTDQTNSGRGNVSGKNGRVILITGCPMGGATEKVVQIIEDNGGWCVAF